MKKYALPIVAIGFFFCSMQAQNLNLVRLVTQEDLSGNAQISYLQYGFMAGPKAGNGHTRRYDLEHGSWKEGESVESWVS